MNQQEFYFELKECKIKAKLGFGFYTKIDLGIAKYNFEIGAGRKILVNLISNLCGLKNKL